MLLEVVGKHLDLINLSDENKWIELPQIERTQLNFRRPMLNSLWQIRSSEADFSDWWKNKNKVTIFFDGASKGNLGEAGAGGVLFNPSGNIIIFFSWGLGKRKNNHAEW